jgi:hypothetical protein
VTHFIRYLRRLITLAGLGLLAVGLSRVVSNPLGAQSPDVHGPFVGPVTYAASFNGDVRRLPVIPSTPQRLRPEAEDVERVLAALTTNAPDAARQETYRPASMPAPIQNFKGLSLAANGSGYPPDTNGDVGPQHYIQTVNTSIGIYSKAGAELAAFSFNALFDGTGTPCDNFNGGDPVVVYDTVSNRWIVTDFAWADLNNGPFYECIAVSQTGDPVNGGWWFYGYLDNATLFPDYPKLGVWPDGIYMSANLFDSFNDFQGVRVWAFDRNRLSNGQPLSNTVYFDLTDGSDSLLASNFRGAWPPAGEPNFFMTRNTLGSRLQMWKFHVDFGTPTNSTFTGPTNLPATPWSNVNTFIPTPANSLDSLSSRLMMQNQYVRTASGESLWLVHTVSSGGKAAIRWYEVRNPNDTPSIYQQSTFQPDSLYRWLGSVAVDILGNMALGYNTASSSLNPEIRYAGRLAGDALNRLGQGEGTIISGGGAQNNTCGIGSCTRWGDYSAMTIDPSDGCTFWYTNEYYESDGGDWQTRIASFRFPACNLPLHSFLPAILR